MKHRHVDSVTRMQGAHRRVSREGNFVVKRPFAWHSTPKTLREHGLRFRTWLRYGRTDVNALEFETYLKHFSKVPSHLKDSFARVEKLEKEGGSDVLYMDFVRNADGTPATGLGQHVRVRDSFFWKRFDDVVAWMSQHRVPLIDLKLGDFMVKELSNGHCVPVLVDYKTVHRSQNSLRVWLRLVSMATRRMQKRYAALKQELQEL